MSGIDHVILTRFNLPTPGVESRIRSRDGWLRDRVELFLRYCAPSVEYQHDVDLRWLVYFDPKSPAWLMERLSPLVSGGLFTPVYRSAVSIQDLVADLDAAVSSKAPFLLTTNLDNDDALARDACRRLQDVDTSEPRAVVYLRNGLIKSSDGLYRRTDRRNAFVSVRESWEAPVTSWSEYHNEFSRLMPTVEIGGPPGWLQVVHGSNVSNRVRGRLVSPRSFQERFGGMLDDVSEPHPRSVAKDRLVRLPFRTARDLGRSGARRAALGLLGKDRYGEVKLRLASWRRAP